MGLVRLLFSYFGRIGRGKFWLGYLAAHIILFGGGAAVVYGLERDAKPGSWLVVIPVFLYLWIVTAISAKRLHDMGRSGLWLLLFFVGAVLIGVWQYSVIVGREESLYPFLWFPLPAWSLIWVLALGLTPGTKEPMRAREAS